MPLANTRLRKNENPEVADFLAQLTISAKKKAAIALKVRTAPQQQPSEIELKVLDSIQIQGAKLIQVNKSDLADLRFSYPGIRIIPEKFYEIALCKREKIKIKTKQLRPLITAAVKVTDDKDKPLPGINVVAFTDYAVGKGASGLTDSNGLIVLKLNSTAVERVYVYADHSYWGYFKKNVSLKEEFVIKLQPITSNYIDGLRHFFDTSKWPRVSQKIRVGIIDTGIGPHRDLQVAGGKNLVNGENTADYQDNGEGHGTHVAGIVGAYGNICGMAAGIELMSYRVFPKGGGASNFNIMKALNQAIADKCHLINMSLGEADSDEGLISYINEAYRAGIICFAANGNDNRDVVSFPASYSLCIAVSAMGTKKTFPDHTVQSTYVRLPYGKNKNDFVAEFSNVGPETDLIAPGVGIISTYPGDLLAVMDGTSMACPIATGLAARLLASRPDIIDLPGTQARADEMIKFLATNIKSMGFGVTFEGKGMLFNNQ